MHEHEASGTTDRDDVEDDDAVHKATDADAGDQELDGFETDFDNVAGALDALDADDLDTAEALVNGLSEAETTVADAEPG